MMKMVTESRIGKMRIIMADIELEKTNGKMAKIDLDPKEYLIIILGGLTAFFMYLQWG